MSNPEVVVIRSIEGREIYGFFVVPRKLKEIFAAAVKKYSKNLYAKRLNCLFLKKLLDCTHY